MKEYKVTITETNIWETKINANSEKEALEKAENEHAKNGFSFEYYENKPDAKGTPIVSFKNARET